MVEVNTKQIETIESGLTPEVLTLLAIKKRGEATELLVNRIENLNHIYTTRDDNKTEMWIYNNGVYVPHGKSFVKEYCRRILGQAFNTHICNEVINKIEADTYIDSDDFFKIDYKNEIPVENGILNILTRDLNPFNPKKIFFNKLPLKYNPNAECPNIDKHLKDVLKSEDDVEVIYEIIGFGLYKDYFLEKMFMFVGDGRNGKGKTIDLMRRFFGVENCASVPLGSLHEDTFCVSELFGKMVNLAGDLSNTSLKHTGMLKQTTGRDLIGAKRKFLTDLKFINHAKHIFACNQLPKVYDMSDGFWDRWLLFEFPFKFIPQSEYDNLDKQERINKKILDPQHIDRISTQQELDGLLNRALDGLDRILINKEFSYSRGSSEVKKFWIRKSDSFIAFCMDNLEETHEGSISKVDLRKSFHNYCNQHKVRGVSDKAMSISLQELFGVIETRRYAEGLTTLLWEGIKFKDSSKYKFTKGEL